jgi:hypothetical protein
VSVDGLTIHFPADDTSDQRRPKVASMAEGAVLVNLSEIGEGANVDFVEKLKYEKPRMGRNQRIGSLREVSRRGRATCLEIAAIVAAAERVAGRNAYVHVISTKYKKKTVPYQYHAVVRYPDGSVFDASELLDGYRADGEWWQRVGHCCASCALDEKCEGNCSCKGGQ